MSEDLKVLSLLLTRIQEEARKRFDGDDYEWDRDWNDSNRDMLYRDVIDEMVKKVTP